MRCITLIVLCVAFLAGCGGDIGGPGAHEVVVERPSSGSSADPALAGAVATHSVGAYLASIPLPTTTTIAPAVWPSPVSVPLPDPELVPVTPAPASGADSWPVSMQPCGGDLPPCYVKARESGGDYSAQNPSSSASGAWQFLDSTWAGFGGYSRAVFAPPDVQDARARELWAGGAGCGHWSACG